MILHSCYYLFFIRFGGQVKQSIESKYLKVVMVDATEIFGARALIPVSAAIGNTLCATLRNMTGRNGRCSRGNIKNKPVDPRIRGGVAVFHNKNEAFGSLRNIAQLERGAYIFSVAGVGSGDMGMSWKCGTGNKHEKLLSLWNGRYMVEGTIFLSEWIPPYRDYRTTERNRKGEWRRTLWLR
jgi:hypothetical protein